MWFPPPTGMKLPIHTDFTRHSTIQVPREGSKVVRGTEPVVWVQSHRALLSDTSTAYTPAVITARRSRV